MSNEKWSFHIFSDIPGRCWSFSLPKLNSNYTSLISTQLAWLTVHCRTDWRQNSLTHHQSMHYLRILTFILEESLATHAFSFEFDSDRPFFWGVAAASSLSIKRPHPPMHSQCPCMSDCLDQCPPVGHLWRRTEPQKTQIIRVVLDSHRTETWIRLRGRKHVSDGPGHIEARCYEYMKQHWLGSDSGWEADISCWLA
jgi:hypothetical protein